MVLFLEEVVFVDFQTLLFISLPRKFPPLTTTAEGNNCFSIY